MNLVTGNLANFVKFIIFVFVVLKQYMLHYNESVNIEESSKLGALGD